MTRPEQKPELDRANRAFQAKERDAFAKRKQRKLVSYAEACKRRLAIDWNASPVAVPAFLGRRVLRDFPLAEIVPYIDWSPFFMAWELTGKYPVILRDAKVGTEASKLFADAEKLLDEIVRQKRLTAHAVYGFYPANSEGDDIIVFSDAGRTKER